MQEKFITMRETTLRLEEKKDDQKKVLIHRLNNSYSFVMRSKFIVMWREMQDNLSCRRCERKDFMQET